MSKDWQIILRCAALGLAIPIVIYTCSFFGGNRPNTALNIVLGVLYLISCPPSLVGELLCFDCGVGTSAF
jgi:hypothetical protein